MLGFRKKEKSRGELFVVVDRTLTSVENVKGPTLSQKMMEDGFAIASTGDTVYACADASATALFPDNHAVGLTLKNGTEILTHVGIGTVGENRSGFACLCERGKRVRKGKSLLKMGRRYPLSEGYDLSAVITFTSKDSYTEFRREEPIEIKGRESVVVTYALPQKRGGLQAVPLQGT